MASNRWLQCWQYRPLALKIARRYFANHEDIEDAVQDAMIKAVRAPYTDNNFVGWWSTVVATICLDRKRKQSRIDAGMQRFTYSVVAGMADTVITEIEIEQALSGLSSPFAETVDLVRCGYLYSEVAQILGTAEGTVKSRMYRVRRMLDSGAQ